MENFNLFGFFVLGFALLPCEKNFESFFETFGAFIMVKFARKNVKMENFQIKCKNV